jgi:hypothetical protein
MTRKILLALCGALLATTAIAGRVNPVTVTINDTWDPVNSFGRTATGTLGGAYNSANIVEFIGCFIHAGAHGIYAMCQARDKAAVYRSCFTWNPQQIAILRELRSDSQVLFQWNEDGTCRNVWVAQRAENPPKRFTP